MLFLVVPGRMFDDVNIGESSLILLRRVGPNGGKVVLVGSSWARSWAREVPDGWASGAGDDGALLSAAGAAT